MSSFTVASIRGIAVEVHWSWLLIFGLLSWMLSTSYYPAAYEDWSEIAYWVVGTVSAIALFTAVLVHELAHAVVARRRGLPVPKITLFIFGGVSHMGRQPATAGEEFKIAAAGPATSLLIAGAAAVGAWVIGGREEHVQGVLTYLSIVNAVLALFNILPGFPLDGGRVLRSIAWRRTRSFRKATRFAASTGQGVGFLMMIGGAVLLLAGGALQGLWFILIGWFLVGAARGEAESLQLETILSNLTARDVMRGEWATVTPGEPLSTLVDDYMIGRGERAVVVANDGRVAGILTVNDIRQVPRAEWIATPAQRVMTPRDRVTTVASTAPAVQVLMIMAQEGINQVPVVDEGRMIGLITRRELIARIQLAESLGDERGPDGPTDPPEGPG